MPRFFTDALHFELDTQTGQAILDGEDGRHIARSLRMHPGEALTVSDGAGFDYDGEIENVYGEAIPETTVITAVVLMLYNIQGTVLMTVKESQGGVDVKGILLSLAKNPMILAIVTAIPFAYFQISLPFVVTKSLGYLQVTAGPLALLTVGASIRLSAVRSDLSLLLKSSAFKLVLQPLLWVALCLAMGLTHRQMVTAVIAGGMPTAVNTYIITKRMGGDGDLAGGAVVISHLLSMLTMTVMIFLMKTAGWI